MRKKLWKGERQYCLRCMRYVKPAWDERRQLWVCPFCHDIICRELVPISPVGE